MAEAEVEVLVRLVGLWVLGGSQSQEVVALSVEAEDERAQSFSKIPADQLANWLGVHEGCVRKELVAEHVPK